jgi:DNA polymerase I-like protein with 3'-5' exonuclease and polymerase domains
MPTIAFDVETTGLNPWLGGCPFAVGFMEEGGEWTYYEWPVDPFTRKVSARQKDLKEIAKILGDPETTIVGHNVKFDIRMMEVNFGIRTRARVRDTMILARVCEAHEFNYRLKDLAARYFDFPKDDEAGLKRATVKARRRGKMEGWAIAEKVEPDYWLTSITDPKAGYVKTYNIGDLERTQCLLQMYEALLDELGVRETAELEEALWPVVYDMESRGVKVNLRLLKQEIARLGEEAEQHKDYVEAVAASGGLEDFKIGSPASLRRLLYEVLRLPVEHRTPKGYPSTDQHTLEKYINDDTVLHLLKYRSTSKNYTTHQGYLSVCRRERTGSRFYWIIHPDFHQSGAATGRFSCSTPNMQNAGTGRAASGVNPSSSRGPYGPRPGYDWILADYEGIEMRMYAELANDVPLLDLFKEDKVKPHTLTVNRVWGGEGNSFGITAARHTLGLDGTDERNAPLVKVLWEQWGLNPSKTYSLDDQRRIANEWLATHGFDFLAAEQSVGKDIYYQLSKTLFYGSIYGIGPYKLSLITRSSLNEAKRLQRQFLKQYASMKGLHDETREFVLTHGYVLTEYGRRISVEADKAYRGVNYRIQGSAADLMKCAMVRLARMLVKTGRDIRMLLTIHDELIYEVRRGEWDVPFLIRVGRVMADSQGAFEIDTPVGFKLVTQRWDQPKPIEGMPKKVGAL